MERVTYNTGNMSTIIEYVEAREKQITTIVPGLQFSQYETLRKIEFYTNSEYFRNRRGANAPKIPFYNITNYRVAVAQRSTDIDTKDIQVTADDPKYFWVSRFYQREVYQWMKMTNFGKFLNEYGNALPKYGQVVVKKCKDKENGLRVEVCDWRNIFTDASDVYTRVVERHYVGYEDIEDREESWENIDKLKKAIDSAEDGKAIVYEGHGVFNVSSSQYPEYKRIHQVVMEDGTVLYQEDETFEQFPYKTDYWEYVPGRMGRGVVEDGFHAQQWTNDVVLKEHEMLELSAKRVFLTNSSRLSGNLIKSVENGEMLLVDDSEYVRPIEFQNPSFAQASDLKAQWQEQYNNVAVTYAANTGETMPSNTPFRTTALLNSEAASHFDYKKEDKGLFLVDIFYSWVLPEISKKASKQHLLEAEFDVDELEQIDEAFAEQEVLSQVIKGVTSGKIKTFEEVQAMRGALKEIAANSGAKRFFDIPAGYYKDFKPKISVVITNESRNKAAVLESISTILTQVSRTPQILQDPVLYKLFGRAVELSGSGISPVDLKKAQTQAEQMPQVPQPQAPQQETMTQ